MNEEMTAQELVDRYSAMIYRLAFVRLQSVQDAEDITQEVLLKYIRCGKSFRDEEHRKAWLLKVTVNAIKSLATSAWHRRAVPIEEAGDIPEPISDTGGVMQAVAALPENYRTVIHLFYFENLSIKQIAKVIGKTEGTVKSQLSRAREKLRIMIEEGEQYV